MISVIFRGKLFHFNRRAQGSKVLPGARPRDILWDQVPSRYQKNGWVVVQFFSNSAGPSFEIVYFPRKSPFPRKIHIHENLD